jgi:hypothetical protein
VIYIDRGYAQENLKNIIRQAHGHHSGSQPRPQNPETFPWTFGHPEKSWNVSTEAGASFTKEAHQRKASGKEVLQYGMCHRDFKGTVVLMSTSMPSIVVPVHRTYADYVHESKFPLSNSLLQQPTTTLNSITCDSDTSGSDFDVQEGQNTSDSREVNGSEVGGESTSDSEDSNDSLTVIHTPTTRANSTLGLIQGFEGDDPLLNDDSFWSDEESEYSDDDDSEDIMLPLMHEHSLKRVPRVTELKNQPTFLFPLMRSWSYIPKNTKTPDQRYILFYFRDFTKIMALVFVLSLCPSRWTGAHIEGNLCSRYLTQSQGREDWRILRNFVMTSTVFLELLSALKHIDLQDEAMVADLDYCCGVLNMKYKKAIVEDAPIEVQEFLSWLQEAPRSTTSQNDWLKHAKYKGV